ncbi:hypothetical protein AAF712_009327 [Marasmius tenuissimus]|uniref:Uncharacterized protein n=1 Tax=Marasmius tenuissimus TaxID=585030 RepID=A0ABR2ZR79_9AGAR
MSYANIDILNIQQDTIAERGWSVEVGYRRMLSTSFANERTEDSSVASEPDSFPSPAVPFSADQDNAIGEQGSSDQENGVAIPDDEEGNVDVEVKEEEEGEIVINGFTIKDLHPESEWAEWLFNRVDEKGYNEQDHWVVVECGVEGLMDLDEMEESCSRDDTVLAILQRDLDTMYQVPRF